LQDCCHSSFYCTGQSLRCPRHVCWRIDPCIRRRIVTYSLRSRFINPSEHYGSSTLQAPSLLCRPRFTQPDRGGEGWCMAEGHYQAGSVRCRWQAGGAGWVVAHSGPLTCLQHSGSLYKHIDVEIAANTAVAMSFNDTPGFSSSACYHSTQQQRQLGDTSVIRQIGQQCTHKQCDNQKKVCHCYGSSVS
jgi:hypothetical protein